MTDVQPEIKEFFDSIIANSPIYSQLVQQNPSQREWVYQKLAHELQVKSDDFLNRNLSSSQLKEYDKLRRKSEQRASDYVVNTIPNFQEKMNQLYDDFYRDWTGLPH